MRVVLIGVSHWHTPFFLNPCLELPGVTIVGASDADLSRAEPVAAKAGCKAYADYREMCATLKPDFAFALARHCDMAELACFLIDQRIPFAMEKPCAINAAEAAEIATRATAAGLFTAVPYVIRYSPLIETIRAMGEPVQYAMFKFIGGMTDRYHQQKVEWVIDRRTSGGGPLLNLGVHFMDLCRVLLPGTDLTVTGAMMSNRNAHLNIEDHAVVLMQGGGASCMVETGYLYPAPNSVFDLHYSIRTANHYFAARDDSTLEIVTNDRRRSTREMKLTNVHFYPTFVRDTLQRLQDGRKAIADLTDNAAAVAMVEAAYAMSPLSDGANAEPSGYTR
jgi:predicted dehydrogenase